ncbi:thioredoxin domain-containing protein [Nesterenkonia sp. MY13]|uniref:Thioredoxin domain-containing protein n=1 Tax=Nesterenkonia sedimenti TaxID=1463632 RepID=A0A7X8TKP3_9MICC|nr:DUF255 domain-containing protein [Nesterenkonia sedimenti]NLS10319.1 thioredoxin domain-containing protein [Nesterenkonia sedimenti]
MANRLADAQSAYLRQHAHNPVDWWPWGSEAFAEAQRRDVPVFISIGYAACHWCHVMAGESFEDEEVAAVLNQRFLSIKVDREEHPEVDDAYMAATQAMTGQGGWPMSVFTTAEGKVFHTGTYFPPQRMGQMPGFTEVLDAVWEAWTQRRDQVEEQAGSIAEALTNQRRKQSQLATLIPSEDSGDSHQELATAALEALVEEEDPVHGGFGAAPKFPPSPLLNWLLEESSWALHSGRDDRAGGLALHTMEAMARSGLFDHIEGGFARYATDKAWQLPHFEKMLYDNAQLIGSYARLSRHPAADAETRQMAEDLTRRSIQWLKLRMLTEQGLLASSLDADTVYEDGTHAEGDTYLFSDDQLIEAGLASGLSQQQSQALAELNRGVPADEHALRSGAPLNITSATPRTLHFDEPLTGENLELWQQVLPELQRIRSGRQQPARDEKIVAAWNAQAVTSIVQASATWADREVLDFAISVAQRLWDIHVENDRVYRTSYDGVRGEGLGTLADHANTASMCFALAGMAENATTWLQRGTALLEFTVANFITEAEGPGPTGASAILDSLDEGGLLRSAALAAHATPVDGPEPSSIASLAQALQSAEALEVRIQKGAQMITPDQILQHVPALAAKAPLAVGGSLLAAGRAHRSSPALRVFSAGPEDLEEVRAAGARYGIPVEPVDASVISDGNELQVSICLNSPAAARCLAPSSSVDEALAQLL